MIILTGKYWILPKHRTNSYKHGPHYISLKNAPLSLKNSVYETTVKDWYQKGIIVKNPIYLEM